MFKQNVLLIILSLPLLATVSVRPVSDSLAISVTQFTPPNITKSTLEKIKKITTSTPNTIVIDLRNNRGGHIHDAIGFGALFVTKNELIQLTTKNNEPLQVTRPKNHPWIPTHRLIILINEHTASAAEAAAHILSHHPNSLTIGRKTHGKNTFNSDSPYKKIMLNNVHPDAIHDWESTLDNEQIILKALAIANQSTTK